jgi:molybdate transport system substrate-binding protein
MNIKKGNILIVLLIAMIVIACEPILNKIYGAQNLIKPSNQGSPPKRTLTVFAAASLTDAFKDIGREFEVAHPGVLVNFSFAGTQVLRMQLEQGASADLFASADHKNMDFLISEGLIVLNSDQDFTTNRLIVILPPGNPGNLETLNGLSLPHIKLILADPSVPAGNYARQVLTRMSKDSAYGEEFTSAVLANVVSNEIDVRQVVTKVELGEADAGIVYLSDVVAVPGLGTIPIPEGFNILARYPIAVLRSSPNPDLAGEFIAYIVSPAGQAVMESWGFTTGE